MNAMLKWISANKKLASTLMFIIVLAVIAIAFVCVVYQGREASLGPLKIGKKAIETPTSDRNINGNLPPNTSAPTLPSSLENPKAIVHMGVLKIRVLKGTMPQTFYGIWVSCAKGEKKTLFPNGIKEWELPIHDVPTATINCKMNEIRWLADAYDPPLVTCIPGLV